LSCRPWVPARRVEMARTDQERLGLFSEPTYISINDKFKDKNAGPTAFNRGANKKKPMMTRTAQQPKNAHADGYFTKGFDRIFSGEATTDPVKQRRKQVAKAKAKNVGGPFRPTPATKKITSSGSYDCTLGGKMDAMSPKTSAKPKHVAEKRNFTTNPAKKGTGYGYNAVTIGKPHEYKTSPYKADQAAARKAATAAKNKQVAGALRLNGPKLGGTFTDDKTAYGPPAKMPKIKNKSRKEPKKLGAPFYPSKPLPSMAGANKNLATFTKFDYSMQKGGPKKEKAKPPKFGTFKPQGVPRSMVQKSVVQMNASRTVNGTNFRHTARA